MDDENDEKDDTKRYVHISFLPCLAWAPRLPAGFQRLPLSWVLYCKQQLGLCNEMHFFLLQKVQEPQREETQRPIQYAG
jgi:hypothetical protein